MSLDSLSSPLRRLPTSTSQASPFKKFSARDELGTWPIIFERHRFLLTMLALLAFLCTVYLYFAVTLGATETCSDLSGAEKALCRAKSYVLHGRKFKLFL